MEEIKTKFIPKKTYFTTTSKVAGKGGLYKALVPLTLLANVPIGALRRFKKPPTYKQIFKQTVTPEIIKSLNVKNSKIVKALSQYDKKIEQIEQSKASDTVKQLQIAQLEKQKNILLYSQLYGQISIKDFKNKITNPEVQQKLKEYQNLITNKVELLKSAKGLGFSSSKLLAEKSGFTKKALMRLAGAQKGVSISTSVEAAKNLQEQIEALRSDKTPETRQDNILISDGTPGRISRYEEGTLRRPFGMSYSETQGGTPYDERYEYEPGRTPRTPYYERSGYEPDRTTGAPYYERSGYEPGRTPRTPYNERSGYEPVRTTGAPNERSEEGTPRETIERLLIPSSASYYLGNHEIYSAEKKELQQKESRLRQIMKDPLRVRRPENDEIIGRRLGYNEEVSQKRFAAYPGIAPVMGYSTTPGYINYRRQQQAETIRRNGVLSNVKNKRSPTMKTVNLLNTVIGSKEVKDFRTLGRKSSEFARLMKQNPILLHASIEKLKKNSEPMKQIGPITPAQIYLYKLLKELSTNRLSEDDAYIEKFEPVYKQFKENAIAAEKAEKNQGQTTYKPKLQIKGVTTSNTTNTNNGMQIKTGMSTNSQAIKLFLKDKGLTGESSSNTVEVRTRTDRLAQLKKNRAAKPNSVVKTALSTLPNSNV